MKRRSASGKGMGLVAAAIIAFTAAGLCSLPVRAETDGQAIVSSSVAAKLSDVQPRQSQPDADSKSDIGSLSRQASSGSAAPKAVKLTAEAARASLASQPQFRGWENADLTYNPLGPGTHSWLVLVQDAGEPAGYMIITQNKDGSFKLNEYGSGSLPPFSLNILQPVLQSLAAADQTTMDKIRVTPVYEEPALAYWKIQSPAGEPLLYIDAFTGQDLPLGEPGWRNKLKQAGSTGTSSAGTASPLTDIALIVTDSAPADASPYTDLAWLKQKPLSLHSGREFEEALQASPNMMMIYSAQGLNYVFNSPFTVNGYQQWASGNHTAPESLYIRTNYTGLTTRYLPFNRLAAAGAFYTIEEK
ncbi:hypothetical protein ACE3NQ_10150 [Paenibacillus terreus]|uniref:Uncharacterized protein n=1 Tax=Paenibacillus terreus TaxID=1387834 RepID=A0ABV5B6F3_9BACL